MHLTHLTNNAPHFYQKIALLCVCHCGVPYLSFIYWQQGVIEVVDIRYQVNVSNVLRITYFGIITQNVILWWWYFNYFIYSM